MRTKTQSIYTKNCTLIPGGVNSPVRSFQSVGIFPPLTVQSGKGDLLIDADGHKYIDYCGSWGALILGHANDSIVKAIQEQALLGTSYGVGTEIEGLLAEKIIQAIASVEKLRFVNSGTEATMTALRLARGFTGKTKIVKFSGHYHGHLDPLLIQAGSGVTNLNPLATSKGISPNVIADTFCLPFNDLATVRSFLQNSPDKDQIAAVILEPVAGNMGVVAADPEFLQMLREETSKLSALLIFDEVMCGFRVGPKGAQGLYNIDADLTCFGKIIGGGFPVAAVGGKKEIMDHLAPLGQVYQAGTLSGNPIAMRAGYETLCQIQSPRFYEALFEKTNRLTKPLQQLIVEKNMDACLQQSGAMFSIFFGLKQVKSKEDLKSLDEEKFQKMFRYLFERGIFIPPSAYEAWFVSSAHTNEHLDYTLACIQDYLNGY